MRGLKHLATVCVSVGFLAPTEPAMALVNNGFETGYFYTTTTTKKTKIHDETVRSGNPEVGQLPEGDLSYNRSCTFAGKTSSDARYFGEVNGAGWKTFWVDERLANGLQVKEVNVSAMAGKPTDIRYYAQDTAVRYNPLGDGGTGTIVTGNAYDDGGGALEIYEIDLGLNAIVNTYYGYSAVADMSMTVDPDTGLIYVEADGDVISFDSQNPTDPYQTVITKAQIGAGEISSVIFRAACAGNNYTDTLLTLPDDGPAKEFYLDGTLMQTHPSVDGTVYDMRLGQQDPVTKDIYIGTIGQNHVFLNADNTVDNWEYGDPGDMWWGEYIDAASPLPEPMTLALLGLGLLCVRRR